MDCVYSISGPLNWEKDGTGIVRIDDGKFVHFNNGSLLINSVNEGDIGTYTCVVLTGFGKTAQCSGDLRLSGAFTCENRIFNPSAIITTKLCTYYLHACHSWHQADNFMPALRLHFAR